MNLTPLFDPFVADSWLCTQHEKPRRPERFQPQIEALTCRDIAVRPRGRPAKRTAPANLSK